MSRDDIRQSPINGVEAPPVLRPRIRYLTDDELSTAWKTSFGLPGNYGPVFRLLMLTGQRRGEVVGLNWAEIDRARAEWSLPASRSKNKHAHIAPLSDRAILELDKAAKGHTWPTQGLIFPSTCGTPLSGFSKVKTNWDDLIEEELNLRIGAQSRHSQVRGPWRLHDLRRTVATGMQALNVRTEIIEAVLNHVSGTRAGIVGVYQCYDFQAEKREALDLWAKHVADLEGMRRPSQKSRG